MESYTSHDWLLFWAYGSFALVFLYSLRIVLNKQIAFNTVPVIPYQFNYFILFFGALFFANEPIEMYSDKWNYQNIFNSIIDNNTTKLMNTESGFYIYNKIIAFFTNTPFVYFFITALIYLSGYLYFIHKTFAPAYRSLVFVLMIAALGFYGYGTNTIRQGLALSVFMFFFMEKKISLKLILGSLIAILLHKSLLFVVVVNFFVIKYNRKDSFIPIWILFLVLSIILGDTFVSFFGDFLIDSDARMNSYLNDEFESYESGFKINFLVYSILPILFGWYIKRKGFEDSFFDKIFSLYVLLNAFWLLVIRVPFTDRFAYLSWFLIPFIFIYPFSKNKSLPNQNFWIAGLMLIIAFVNLLISTK